MSTQTFPRKGTLVQIDWYCPDQSRGRKKTRSVGYFIRGSHQKGVGTFVEIAVHKYKKGFNGFALLEGKRFIFTKINPPK